MGTSILGEEYIFSIANTKKKFYYFFAFFIIIINAVLLTLIRINYSEGPLKNWKLFGVVLYIILFSILFFIRREKEKTTLSVFTFILVITAWLVMAELLPAIINLIILLLFKISTRSLVIKINAQRIIYPSFPSLAIGWNELNNVILKDGLLTIDLKNNKVYQHYPEEISLVDEAIFNSFCKQHIQPVI
ncbi:MAG: hypothetical protein IPH18_03660 [Chitinophagaceae bacterium]|nr:hypothetical protein [Chitinophagaceae bacterium]